MSRLFFLIRGQFSFTIRSTYNVLPSPQEPKPVARRRSISCSLSLQHSTFSPAAKPVYPTAASPGVTIPTEAAAERSSDRLWIKRNDPNWAAKWISRGKSRVGHTWDAGGRCWALWRCCGLHQQNISDAGGPPEDPMTLSPLTHSLNADYTGDCTTKCYELNSPKFSINAQLC